MLDFAVIQSLHVLTSEGLRIDVSSFDCVICTDMVKRSQWLRRLSICWTIFMRVTKNAAVFLLVHCAVLSSRWVGFTSTTVDKVQIARRMKLEMNCNSTCYSTKSSLTQENNNVFWVWSVQVLGMYGQSDLLIIIIIMKD